VSYEQWIEAFEEEQKFFLRGKCKEAAKKMILAFPELRLACGFAYCSWGRDEHWWCVTQEGRVVDPTASQFRGPVAYKELDPNDPETRKIVPTGVCADCGEPVYGGKSFCSDRCQQLTEEYLNHVG
jgi:hypothetical protein